MIIVYSKMNILRSYRKLFSGAYKMMENKYEPPADYELLPKHRVEEPIDVKRARLLYQSRKRGILENCLLLGTFASDNLNSMDAKLLHQYDEIINLPTEWELYYWVMGARAIPQRFDNEIMALLKSHVRKNEQRLRSSQPDITIMK